ncbi:MAG: Sua5/YciO/YrdC/YwlC family protein [Candidatus Krumholzibacteriia bacterium]
MTGRERPWRPPVWQSAASAAAALGRGRVLLLPTDTLPGLHARVDRPAAVRRISLLKGRAVRQPFLVLAADLGAACDLAQPLTSRVHAFLAQCWPGPFTVILPAAGGGTVAVRVPALEILRDLLRRVRAPLVSTSANRHGEAPATDLALAWALWRDRVDGAWDPAGEIAPAAGGRQPSVAFPDRDHRAAGGDPPRDPAPSTLIDATVWPPLTVRAGARPAPPAPERPAEP